MEGHFDDAMSMQSFHLSLKTGGMQATEIAFIKFESKTTSFTHLNTFRQKKQSDNIFSIDL